eukprot:scaffold4242_cov175-Amphora_coffeaeformis.AAC.11
MAPVSLTLKVLSLRYSSWSMRPWLVMAQSGTGFNTETVSLAHMVDPTKTVSLAERRKLGSVRGLFPVLHVQTSQEEAWIHESLAISEYISELNPDANLWPEDPLERARARALCCEMVSGFPSLRDECSCVLFARVPSFTPAPATLKDIERVFEIWSECLARSGGHFLFGPHFGIVDAMYYPVLTRFRTYCIDLPNAQIEAYAKAVESSPTVMKLVDIARKEPSIPTYDDYIRKLGGDPEKEL